MDIILTLFTEKRDKII